MENKCIIMKIVGIALRPEMAVAEQARRDEQGADTKAWYSSV